MLMLLKAPYYTIDVDTASCSCRWRFYWK